MRRESTAWTRSVRGVISVLGIALVTVWPPAKLEERAVTLGENGALRLVWQLP